MPIDAEAQFPSLDPKTGKLRPKHVPVPEGAATEESLDDLLERLSLSDTYVWGKTEDPPLMWINAVRALGKTPLSLADLRRDTDGHTANYLLMDGSLSREAVISIIAPVIAESPDVTEAAALAAAAAVTEELILQDVVVRSDLGAPVVGEYEGEAGVVAAYIDKSGRASHVIFEDGEHYVPILSSDSHKIRGAGTWRFTQNDEYMIAFVDPDDRVGFGIPRTGGLPDFIMEQIRTYLFGASGSIVVIGILGQSNATQADNPTAELSYDSGDKILLWNPGLGRGAPIARGAAWLGSGLAREINARYPNQRVLIVRCAEGETGFTSSSLTPPPAGHTTVPNGTWDRTLTDDPKNLALQAPGRLTAALTWAQGESSSSWLDGIIWSQGEQDRGLSQTDYATRLDDYISYLRGQVGVSNLPVVVTGFEPQFSRDPANNTAAVESALRDTPRRILRSAYHDGPDNLGDHSGLIHWSGEGQELRGRAVVDSLIRARLNMSNSEPISPQNLKVTRSGSLVEISWSPPPCRVLNYILETSTDSGVNWISRTLAQPLSTDMELTITSTTAVWTRVSTVNEVGTSEPSKVVKR